MSVLSLEQENILYLCCMVSSLSYLHPLEDILLFSSLEAAFRLYMKLSIIAGVVEQYYC